MIMQKKINCIILASGNGSNALNLIRVFHIYPKEHKNAACSINISAVVSNIEKAPVIEKVRIAAPDIPVFFLPYASVSEREYFEKELESIMRKYNINCIILAGFMRILSKEFVSKFHNKIINIHPSLLPAFKGKDAIKDAFDYGVKYTGVTVHYVTPEVDAGPIICQEAVKIEENDTLETLELKIHDVEHKIYPAALKKIFV
ncbi:MAG: phosphoribosylglycinamide formyltransferase [Candidatus Acidulodesulfobacterium sp.]